MTSFSKMACVGIVLVCVICVRGRADEILPGISGAELATQLRRDYLPERSLSYRKARHEMFSKIDNREGKVILVYTGRPFATTDIPNPNIVNTEHTWPQSKFNHGPIKSDLHHLFPTYNKVNGARGNSPFAEIPDENTRKWWRSAEHQTAIPEAHIEEYSESINSAFEPREIHKGNVARAMIYVYTIYGNRSIEKDWFEAQIPTHLAWHESDPIDDRERERSRRIEEVQGNENPFVLDPSLFRRVLELPDTGDDEETDDPAHESASPQCQP